MATLRQKTSFGPGTYRGHKFTAERLRQFAEGTNKAIAAGVPIPLLKRHAPINADDAMTQTAAQLEGSGWVTKVEVGPDGALEWEAKDVPDEVAALVEKGTARFTSPEFRDLYTSEKAGVYTGPIIRHFAFTPLPGNPHQGPIEAIAMSEEDKSAFEALKNLSFPVLNAPGEGMRAMSVGAKAIAPEIGCFQFDESDKDQLEEEPSQHAEKDEEPTVKKNYPNEHEEPSLPVGESAGKSLDKEALINDDDDWEVDGIDDDDEDDDEEEDGEEAKKKDEEEASTQHAEGGLPVYRGKDGKPLGPKARKGKIGTFTGNAQQFKRGSRVYLHHNNSGGSMRWVSADPEGNQGVYAPHSEYREGKWRLKSKKSSQHDEAEQFAEKGSFASVLKKHGYSTMLASKKHPDEGFDTSEGGKVFGHDEGHLIELHQPHKGPAQWTHWNAMGAGPTHHRMGVGHESLHQHLSKFHSKKASQHAEDEVVVTPSDATRSRADGEAPIDDKLNPDMPPVATDRSKLSAAIAGMNQLGLVVPSDFDFAAPGAIDVLLAAINTKIKTDQEAEAEKQEIEPGQPVTEAAMPFSEQELEALPPRARAAIEAGQRALQAERAAKERAEAEALQFAEQERATRNNAARDKAKHLINIAVIPPGLRTQLLESYDGAIQFEEGEEQPCFTAVEVAQMVQASLPPALQFLEEMTVQADGPPMREKIGTDANGKAVFKPVTSEQFFEGEPVPSGHIDPARAEEIVRGNPVFRMQQAPAWAPPDLSKSVAANTAKNPSRVMNN